MPDPTLRCWGHAFEICKKKPGCALPTEQMKQIACGSNCCCGEYGFVLCCHVLCSGLSLNGTVHCFGPQDTPFVELHRPDWPAFGGCYNFPRSEKFVQITASNYHACALHQDGNVTCWQEKGVLRGVTCLLQGLLRWCCAGCD